MNKKLILFITVGIAILAMLFWLLRPVAPVPELRTQDQAQDQAQTQQPQIFLFTVVDGKRTTGPAVVEVPVNTKISLQVDSDKPDELHVHGYDLSKQIAPGKIQSLNFVADRSGRFAVELHGAHAELTTLQVQP